MQLQEVYAPICTGKFMFYRQSSFLWYRNVYWQRILPCIVIICLRLTLLPGHVLLLSGFLRTEGSVPVIAQEVPLLTMSHFSACSDFIIVENSLVGHLGLLNSAKRNCGGPANRVRECLLSLRYRREIFCF